MILTNRFNFAALVILALFSATHAKSAENNSIIATIRPLHAIVATIMDGVGSPRLLLTGQQDAHHTSLKPSQIRGLLKASIIFRIGRDMENFLNPVFKSLDIEGKVYSVTDFSNLTRLTYPDNSPDPHVWLNSGNAIAIATGVTKALAQADAANKVSYQKNLIKFTNDIAKMTADLSEMLRGSKSRKYLVDHDALQYFATEFGLQIQTIGNRNEELAPTAKQIGAVHDLITSNLFDCIIVENGAGSAAIRSIAKDALFPVVLFDPIGSQFEAGPRQYIKLMHKIAVDIAQCN